MSETQSIGLQLLDPRNERARPAIDAIVAAIPGAEATEPDPADGTFEIRVQADSYDAALRQVFDAVGAAGADDHVVFTEHPDIAHHWEHGDETPA
jgi:hypothetical protein